jgi:hypothetical protein
MTSATDWKSLSHAYGYATDLPALLDRVRVAPSDKAAWSDLHYRLYHQGTVYPASYAVRKIGSESICLTPRGA